MSLRTWRGLGPVRTLNHLEEKSPCRRSGWTKLPRNRLSGNISKLLILRRAILAHYLVNLYFHATRASFRHYGPARGGPKTCRRSECESNLAAANFLEADFGTTSRSRPWQHAGSLPAADGKKVTGCARAGLGHRFAHALESCQKFVEGPPGAGAYCGWTLWEYLNPLTLRCKSPS